MAAQSQVVCTHSAALCNPRRAIQVVSVASPIARRMPSTVPPSATTYDRALARTDPPFAVVQCTRPDSGAPVRASSTERAGDHCARPSGASDHAIDYGSACSARPGRCWSAEPICDEFDAFGARRATSNLPLCGNALTVFDASFAHHERIISAVEAAATLGPCGGRMRRQRSDVMTMESDHVLESDASGRYSRFLAIGS